MSTRHVIFAALVITGYAFLPAAVKARCAETQHRFVFCATAENDLVRVAAQCGLAATRCDSPEEAVQTAPAGSGVLILADGYPERATTVTTAVLETAASKHLRLYIEYPAALPGLQVGPTMEFAARDGLSSLPTLSGQRSTRCESRWPMLAA